MIAATTTMQHSTATLTCPWLAMKPPTMTAVSPGSTNPMNSAASPNTSSETVRYTIGGETCCSLLTRNVTG